MKDVRTYSYVTIISFIIAIVSSLNAQWIQMNKMHYGDILINSFTVNDSTLFAGTVCGIFRSNDIGTTWEYINNGQWKKDVLDFRKCGNTLFAVTRYGLYRSVDSGMNWTWVDFGRQFPNRVISDFEVVNDSSAFILYYESPNYRLSRSTDEGETWDICNSGFPDSIREIEVSEGIIFLTAGEMLDIYRSTDCGRSWDTSASEIYPYVSSIKAARGIIIAYQKETVFRSTDNGESWNVINSTDFPGWIGEMAVIDSTIVIANLNWKYCSIDKGTTWFIDSSFVSANIDINRIVVIDETFYAVTGKGIYTADKKLNVWERADSIGGRKVDNLWVCENCLITLQNGKYFQSTDRGKNWVVIDGFGLPYDVKSITVVNNTIYAENEYAVFSSNDNGIKWSLQDFGLHNINNQNGGSTRFEFIDDNLINIFTVDSVWWKKQNELYLLAKEDEKEGWYQICFNIPEITLYALVMIDNILIAGTDNGIYRSIDQGSNWSCVLSSRDRLYADVTVIDDTIIALTNQGLFRSSDGGYIWSKLKYELPDTCAVESFKKCGRNMVVRTGQNRIFFSANDGINWVKIDSGLPENSIKFLEVDNDKIYVGYNYGGLWYRQVTKIDANIQSIQNKTELRSNFIKAYKCGSRLEIVMTVEQTEDILLTIQSFSGKKMVTLVNSNLHAGSYRYRWNTGPITSGNYIISMRSGNRVYSKIVPFVR